MSYPINYDFGKHWNSKIKQHLDNPKILNAIRKGVNMHAAYESDFYKKNTPPAQYSYRDHYDSLMTRKEEKLIKQLRKENKLPTEYLEMERKMREMDDDDYEELDKLGEKILEPYMSWNVIRYNLESYYLLGGCHEWAPTFELTLARLVEPNEKWRVRTGKSHSTVINQNDSKVFDLLYWACPDSRIEIYMFGKPMKNFLIDKSQKNNVATDVVIDTTLGGKQAYIDSA